MYLKLTYILFVLVLGGCSPRKRVIPQGLHGWEPKDVKVIHRNNKMQIWQHTSGNNYAVIYDEEVIAEFTSKSQFIKSFDKNGNSISMPITAPGKSNMRFFYYHKKDHSSTLIDYNADGQVDAKHEIDAKGGKRFFIYKHGSFVEANHSEKYTKKKKLPDGQLVYFEKGEWIEFNPERKILEN